MKRTLEQGTGRAAGQQPFDLNSPNAQTRSTPGATGSPGTPGSVGTPAQHKAPTMASRPAPGDAFSLDDSESMGELSRASDDASEDDSTDETPELFSEKDLKQRTELKVEDDTSGEDLQTLRMALPSNTTITRIALDGSHPEAAKAVLTALQTNVTVMSLSVVCWQSCFDPTAAAQLTALPNEFRRNDDANSPVLGKEEAIALASAIDTVLPQEEAQRVLDVLHFADIRHA